ncbi:MAG: hypothetical protein A3B06_03035 [Candidatus Yonathbacteria bacterium RIFCSPLOWO2_01_FULL_43_20]|uniref:Uncharacterized protein n=1 Tax=Candidatus Yonathbacteria bacterium RIFCSPHIGHO2_02_FULL_44_14 TaxID=1802724 RepID=A0A1G2S8B5_9BACT|nr:MAG: hypothetical protein A3B06_03035 [Candidatus Yonathbacteria bacterium RIFCSPLOWO2_01_FULL_43_20]OHA81340.1 MAG: hypothetical protein A3D51_02050 [Candidatus Yonathbacteria bacterium RIFCSPHIGHO2_02_FULL_44_14]
MYILLTFLLVGIFPSRRPRQENFRRIIVNTPLIDLGVSCGGLGGFFAKEKRLTGPNYRHGELLLIPLPPEGTWQDEDPRLVTALVYSPVSAEEVMGKNFFGRTAYEKELRLNKSLPEKHYLKLGLPGVVPFFLDTLNSPCPFVKGRLIRHTHVLMILEKRAWKGKVPCKSDRWKLGWVLCLKGPSYSVEAARSLDLPPEYKKMYMLGKEETLSVVIERKYDVRER